MHESSSAKKYGNNGNKGNISMKTLTVETYRLMTKLSKSLDLSLSQHMDDQIIQSILLDWGEAIARLENMALRIETYPDDNEAMGEIKRTLHTIKGDSGACGLYEVSDVFHQVEDLLEDFIEEDACPADMLLRTKDWLQQILDTIASGTVQIELLASSDEDSEKKGLEAFPPQERSRLNSTPLKTLIVEDDFTSRLLLQELLNTYGQSHVTVNGREAVEAVDAALETDEPYDLICLDIMMPGVDGVEVCRRIRKIETSIPTYIILLTELGSKKDIIKGLEAGADDYITKPFDKDELHARIKAGHRIIELQVALAEKEKFQGVLEMAGAVCHEMNQPLQVAGILSELILSDMASENPLYPTVGKIKGQIDRMGEITRKLMSFTRYKTKDYLKCKIIDIKHASK